MVTSIDGCMDHLLPLEEMREAALRITQTSLVEPEALKLRLVNMGLGPVRPGGGPGTCCPGRHRRLSR